MSGADLPDVDQVGHDAQPSHTTYSVRHDTSTRRPRPPFARHPHRPAGDRTAHYALSSGGSSDSRACA